MRRYVGSLNVVKYLKANLLLQLGGEHVVVHNKNMFLQTLIAFVVFNESFKMFHLSARRAGKVFSCFGNRKDPGIAVF